MNQRDDEAIDRAINVLDANPIVVTPVDNVYPWWQTLRTPLTLGALALLLSAITGAFLGVSTLITAQDDERDDERAECYQRHTEQITEASAITRRTSARVDNEFGLGLLVAVYGDELPELGTLDVPAPRDILDAIAANDAALVADREANQAREAWVAAGQPLPCPIQPPQPPEE